MTNWHVSVVFYDVIINAGVFVDEAVVGRGNAAGGPSVKFNSKRYAMEIFKAGLAPEPKNPYFVTRALHKRKTDLVST